MVADLKIRPSKSADLPAIDELYRTAFPDEDLLPLVRSLLSDQYDLVSMVGTIGQDLITHVIFTKGSVEQHDNPIALLAPLAVAPAWQKKGVGSQMVRHGLQQMQHDGISHVFVLGDPKYYGRFGFTSETEVKPPYPLPAEWKDAWQSISLGDDVPRQAGSIRLPDPWLRSGLWSP